MSGLGYNVKAEVFFTSNGVELMRDLGRSVQAVAVTIDTQTKALLANAKAWTTVARAARAATAAQVDAARAARDVSDTMSRTAAATSDAARGYDGVAASARRAATAIVAVRDATAWGATGAASRAASVRRATASDAAIIPALRAAAPQLALSPARDGAVPTIFCETQPLWDLHRHRIGMVIWLVPAALAVRVVFGALATAAATAGPVDRVAVDRVTVVFRSAPSRGRSALQLASARSSISSPAE